MRMLLVYAIELELRTNPVSLYIISCLNYPVAIVKTRKRNLLVHGGSTTLSEIGLLGLGFMDTLGESSSILVLFGTLV
jgi:hypothetical protein